MRRVLLVLATLIALPLVAVPAFVVTHREDLAEIDDADLEIHWLDLAPEENGFWHLERAAEALDWPEEDEWVWATLRGEGFEEARTVELLERNQEAVRHLRRALESDAFQAPVGVLDLDYELDPVWRTWATGSALLALEGILHGHHGSKDAWFVALMDVTSLGRRIETAIGGDRLQTAIGTFVKARGPHAIRESVGWIELDERTARRLDARLTDLHAHGWPQAWSAHYQSFKRFTLELPIHEFESGPSEGLAAAMMSKLPASYFFKPQRTVQLYAERIRTARAAADLACNAVEARRARDWTSWEKARMILSPNGVGRTLAEISSPEGPVYQMRRCEEATLIEATRATVALRRHQLESGSLPDRLDELVPKHLSGLPRDGYDGRPLRYDREKRLLWSVGLDFADTDVLEADYRAGEPRFPIHF